MKKTILPLLCLLLAMAVNAQRNKPIIDSIERVIKTQTDTNLVKSYSELTWQYRLVNRQKAVDYGLKAIALGKKLNFQKGLAQAYNDLGIIYYDKENYDSSILLYQEGMKIREQLHDELGMARLYNKIGIVYQKQGKFGDALYNQQYALALFEKTGNDIGISYSLNNIGILQQNLGRFDEAINYHNQSIAIKKKLNDRAGILQSYINVANIFKIKEEFDKAETYYIQAVDLARQIGNKEYLSNVLNNLGDLYSRKKNYAKAEQLTKESYELRASTNDTKGIASCLNNWGDILIELKKYDSADLVLHKGEQIAKNGINTKSELILIYQTLSKLYERKGDATNSLDYYKKYAAFKDSLFNDGLSSKFAELETKYNSLEKEKLIQQQKSTLTKKLYELSQQKLQLSLNQLQIAGNDLEIQRQNETILEQRLDSTNKEKHIQGLQKQGQIDELEIKNQKLQVNKRNITIIVISILTVMLTLLGISFYRRYKLKKEKQLQEEVFKQQELATKAILEAEENERKRIAGDLHDGVGQLMSAAKMNLSAIEGEIPFANEDQRKVYAKAQVLVDESCKEVRSVSHNMMPNALLKSGLASAVREFLNKIDARVIKVDLYTEGLSERIDANVETVLYRVIQESVNNVIKHSGANHLDISLIKDEDGIAATIEDNGKGFDSSDRNKFDGIGLKNIKTRIEYLKGTVEWNSSVGKGTLVAIHVPVSK
jgi:two-component system NarL family sensor kinase